MIMTAKQRAESFLCSGHFILHILAPPASILTALKTLSLFFFDVRLTYLYAAVLNASVVASDQNESPTFIILNLYLPLPLIILGIGMLETICPSSLIVLGGFRFNLLLCLW